MRNCYHIFILIMFFYIASASGTELYNGDFEFFEPNSTTDFNQAVSWQSDNYAVVVSNFIPNPEQGDTRNWQIDVNTGLNPYYGEHFVILSTGDITPEPDFAAISQQVHINEGWTLSGYYFFGTCDYSPYSDYANIKMVPSDQNSPLREIILVDVTVEDVNDYGSFSGWRYFSYTFGSNEVGIYDIVLTVVDRGDNIYKSYLAADYLKLECLKNGDINGDCKVDFIDFAMLAQDWMVDCFDPDIDCSDTDLFPDQDIDFKDLSVLADNWLAKKSQNGDINGDCTVNLLDFAMLAQDWMVDCFDPEIDCSDTDLFPDQDIDFKDLSVLADNWLDKK